VDPPVDLSVLRRDASQHGLTPDVLRGPRWQRLSHGLYGPTGWIPTGWDRWAAVSRVLPVDAAAGHLTSAALRGWWLPMLPGGVPLFATTATGTHVQRPGVYVRRSPRTAVETINGVSVVTAASTVLELAMDLAPLDLVPIVESAARVDGCQPAEVLRLAPARMRGLAALRTATALADPRSESWFETMLRLVHVLAGLDVEPQRDVRDSAGQFVARADLWLVGAARAVEYDGESHRDRARHVDDLRREKALRRADVDRWAYSRGEVEHDPGQIIRDAEDALGLARDRRRIDAWWQAARMATITARGRRRLAARIARYRRAATR